MERLWCVVCVVFFFFPNNDNSSKQTQKAYSKNALTPPVHTQLTRIPTNHPFCFCGNTCKQTTITHAQHFLQDATSAYTANLLMASVAGLPAVVVPCGLTKPRPGAPAGTPDAERLPVALEFMGLPEKDDKLLAIAAAFQRLAPMLADPIVVAAFKTGVGRDMTS